MKVLFLQFFGFVQITAAQQELPETKPHSRSQRSLNSIIYKNDVINFRLSITVGLIFATAILFSHLASSLRHVLDITDLTKNSDFWPIFRDHVQGFIQAILMSGRRHKKLNLLIEFSIFIKFYFKAYWRLTCIQNKLAYYVSSILSYLFFLKM